VGLNDGVVLALVVVRGVAHLRVRAIRPRVTLLATIPTNVGSRHVDGTSSIR
jgi:hypothetical protein